MMLHAAKKSAVGRARGALLGPDGAVASSRRAFFAAPGPTTSGSAGSSAALGARSLVGANALASRRAVAASVAGGLGGKDGRYSAATPPSLLLGCAPPPGAPPAVALLGARAKSSVAAASRGRVAAGEEDDAAYDAAVGGGERSHHEAWMVNLGRGDDAWLTGPRGGEWFTGLEPAICPGESLFFFRRAMRAQGTRVQCCVLIVGRAAFGKDAGGAMRTSPSPALN